MAGPLLLSLGRVQEAPARADGHKTAWVSRGHELVCSMFLRGCGVYVAAAVCSSLQGLAKLAHLDLGRHEEICSLVLMYIDALDARIFMHEPRHVSTDMNQCYSRLIAQEKRPCARIR